MISYDEGAVHQQRSNIRVEILPLAWCNTSSIYSRDSSSCAIITPIIYTLHSNHSRSSSPWSARLQPKWRNWSLESCAVVFGGCVFHSAHAAHYIVCVHVLLFWCIILSFCLETSHTATGVMKTEVYTAVSETPYVCSMVRRCLYVWVCVFLWVCVYVSLHVPAYLIVCLLQQSSWKDADKPKRRERLSKEAKWERERETELQFTVIF